MAASESGSESGSGSESVTVSEAEQYLLPHPVKEACGQIADWCGGYPGDALTPEEIATLRALVRKVRDIPTIPVTRNPILHVVCDYRSRYGSFTTGFETDMKNYIYLLLDKHEFHYCEFAGKYSEAVLEIGEFDAYVPDYGQVLKVSEPVSEYEIGPGAWGEDMIDISVELSAYMRKLPALPADKFFDTYFDQCLEYARGVVEEARR